MTICMESSLQSKRQESRTCRWVSLSLVLMTVVLYLMVIVTTVQETLEEVRKERRERALLGSQPAYTRIYY